jgi:hypothetical protein
LYNLLITADIMKFFDLTCPEGVGESNPKIHKVFFEDFKKAWIDFPRPLAERMVELGYGKWAPCGVDGRITVPQEMIMPLQIFFISLRHGGVKAVHVWSLVPEEDNPTPKDLVAFCENLKTDVWFKHDPEDLKEDDSEEYDDQELYDSLIEAEKTEDEPPKKAEKPKTKKPEGDTPTKEGKPKK